jgi:hypothetical protein
MIQLAAVIVLSKSKMMVALSFTTRLVFLITLVRVEKLMLQTPKMDIKCVAMMLKGTTKH